MKRDELLYLLSRVLPFLENRQTDQFPGYEELGKELARLIHQAIDEEAVRGEYVVTFVGEPIVVHMYEGTVWVSGNRVAFLEPCERTVENVILLAVKAHWPDHEWPELPMPGQPIISTPAWELVT